jgi:hypothetical protein
MNETQKNCFIESERQPIGFKSWVSTLIYRKRLVPVVPKRSDVEYVPEVMILPAKNQGERSRLSVSRVGKGAGSRKTDEEEYKEQKAFQLSRMRCLDYRETSKETFFKL